jgi:hypothetical protein
MSAVGGKQTFGTSRCVETEGDQLLLICVVARLARTHRLKQPEVAASCARTL